jgi:hypothetical protein
MRFKYRASIRGKQEKLGKYICLYLFWRKEKGERRKEN